MFTPVKQYDSSRPSAGYDIIEAAVKDLDLHFLGISNRRLLFERCNPEQANDEDLAERIAKAMTAVTKEYPDLAKALASIEAIAIR